MQKNIFIQHSLAAAVLLVIAGSGVVQAEETMELPTTVITGVAQSSAGVVVTDPRLPRQPVPASDGADYLKTIPGFSALRNGGVNGDPVFRGMFGSRLKLLTNGGEMLGACPSRMDSPSSYISPETYDKLTVIKGPQSVQWGPGNSAATVLFERGPEEFDALGARLDASVLVGSNARFDTKVDAAVGGEQGYMRILGNTSKADDYKDGAGDKVHSQWDKWNADLALGWTPSTDTLIELSGGTGDGEAAYAGRGMDGTKFKRESLGLRFKQENLGTTWQVLEGQVYYNYADHIMDNYKLRKAPNNPNAGMPMMRGPFVSQVDRRTAGGRIKSTWRWDSIELVAGIDGQQNEHRGRKGPAADYTAQSRVKDAEFTQVGVFAENTWLLNSNDRVISGVRLDRHTATDKRVQLCTMMNACLANPTADQERSKTMPSGFARWEHDLTSLPATTYVGVGHSQRFPDYWEMFSASLQPIGMPVTGFEPTAFATVKPEKTTQLDFGLQYQNGPIEMWASGYVGVLNDYLLFDYQTSSSSVSNIDAQIMGAELGGSHYFAPGWKAEFSLAYAWGENTSDNRPLPQMPPLEANFGLNYEQDNWSASFLSRLVSKQTRVAKQQGNVTGKDFDESSGFAVFSLNGAYRLNSNLSFSTGIDNLFDKEYSEHLNLAGNNGLGYAANTRINETGRTFWARMDVSF